MTARNVSLTDRLDTFVEQQVSTGRHQSASEVVREALRRYEADLTAEAACIEMIRGIAHAGRDAIARLRNSRRSGRTRTDTTRSS